MERKIDQLVDYCQGMSMSYSYKPVLILALLNYNGRLHIRDAADFFSQFYGNRLSMGLDAERSNSIFSNLNCTVEQIASNIRSNPVKALLNSDYFVYDKDCDQFGFISEIQSDFTIDYQKKIADVCLNRLDEYYSRIRDYSYQNVVCFHNPNEENGYLSNWFRSSFSYLGSDFSSVEQYMMYRKALIFGDWDVRNRILATDDVAEIKQLGRLVKNYSDRIWGGQRQVIVYQGLLAKFSQNDELRRKLLDTGNATLAECAVSDRVWGIGLSMTDERRFFPNQWQGSNLLGYSLMQVRNVLHETRNL